MAGSDDLVDGWIMKVTSSGALDPSFANGGIYGYATGNTEWLVDVVTDSLGNVYGLGATNVNGSVDPSILKLSADGIIDLNFGTNGFAIYPLSSNEDNPYEFVLSENSLYVAGHTNNGSNKDTMIYKTDLNGNPVEEFGSSGVLVFDINGSDDSCRSIAKDADGRILCGGFSVKSGNAASLVIRIWP